jgi:dephospho-CoA kinase
MTFVPHEVAKQRLMTRNYLTEEQAEQRIRSQMSNEEKARHVHWVLDTNRPKEETEKIVLQKWEELLRELNITYLPALQTILHE